LKRRRVLTITVAILLAAFGTVLVLAYVHQANLRAVQGIKAVSVLVAGSEIPSGTPAGQALRQGSLVHQTEPSASVPADAIRSITPDLAGLVTNGNVPSGAVLTRSMLVSAAEVTGGVAIPKGLLAVTVQLCVQEDVAGYVTPGSRVAVFDTSTTGRQTGQPDRTCSVDRQSFSPSAVNTALVLPRVEVLSVGPAPATSQSTSSGGFGSATAASAQGAVLVTLAVTQAEAEKLISLEQAELPYLALLTPSSQTGVTSAPGPLSQP
jgi:pilus assembly protein CpaB